LRVNIIGKSNGVGLDRDAALLAHALSQAGCVVTITKTGSRESGRRKSILFKGIRALRGIVGPRPRRDFDLNVMLEHVWSQYVPYAYRSVVVPNPDFFDKHDLASLGQVNRVWAKTRHAEQIFKELGPDTTYIGFDSEDRLQPEVRRKRVCFHLAGNSQLKGTKRLLDVWSKHSHWPELWVVGRLKLPVPCADNIKIHSAYVDDAALKRMQNEAMIHVCTSEAEGWGHYLVEAMSVGSAVITVDAPPMNELVESNRGWLLDWNDNGMHRLAQRYAFDENSLIRTMEGIIKLNDDQLRSYGLQARNWFVSNKLKFAPSIKSAVNSLLSN